MSWDFDDSQHLLKATQGLDLILHGSHLAIAGPGTNDGAVRIGVGSHYECTHQIPAGAAATRVNRFSLLIDFRFAAIGPHPGLRGSRGISCLACRRR